MASRWRILMSCDNPCLLIGRRMSRGPAVFTPSRNKMAEQNRRRRHFFPPHSFQIYPALCASSRLEHVSNWTAWITIQSGTPEAETSRPIGAQGRRGIFCGKELKAERISLAFTLNASVFGHSPCTAGYFHRFLFFVCDISGLYLDMFPTWACSWTVRGPTLSSKPVRFFLHFISVA